jgi:heme exporter protein CcmD
MAKFDDLPPTGYAWSIMSTFSDLHAFLRMGGYAAAVWPAYGLVFLVLLIQFVAARRKWQHLRRALYHKYVKSP